MRSFGFFGALLILVIAVVAGMIGYNMGIGANVAAQGVPVVYHHGWGLGSLLLGVLFLFLIFGAIKRMAWGGHRAYGPGGPWRHGYGRHGWGDKSVPPMADEMLGRWHREAHGEPEPTGQDKPAG